MLTPLKTMNKAEETRLTQIDSDMLPYVMPREARAEEDCFCLKYLSG